MHVGYQKGINSIAFQWNHNISTWISETNTTKSLFDYLYISTTYEVQTFIFYTCTQGCTAYAGGGGEPKN